MFKILIDTCVWLDLAKDYQQQPILTAIEELIRMGDIDLILPRTVLDEFARNKGRIIEESSRSLSGTMKRVKEAGRRSSPAHARFGITRNRPAAIVITTINNFVVFMI